MMSSDTVYALSSGIGKAGIAVVRLSGRLARDVVAALSGSLPAPRQAVLRPIRNPMTGEVLDRGLVLWFPGPNSVTGEDIAEFHLHGSSAVIRGVFDAFNGFEGVRPAEAGEFTRRAFGNGRIDLVEAEGLADLLNARTGRQRQQAMHHVMGHASSVYEDWRGRLLRSLARVEAAVDFVEEDGVAEAALSDVSGDVEALVDAMSGALASAERASAVRDGIKIVLAGLPNTGKSSLLNVLARREAAIVSSWPGTTRDVIEVAMEIEGMAVLLSDTAGLRDETSDEIERIGIERSRREAGQADIVVWVSSPDVEGSEMPAVAVKASVLVMNKADVLAPDSGLLRNDYRLMGHLPVSARTGDGIAGLIVKLAGLIHEKYGQIDDPVIVRSRQRQAILESIRHLNDSLGHDPMQLELVAEDLRKTAHALGRVTGRIDVEDLLSAIFSEFCIGK
jgi:tRNA modification GTPase